MTTKEIQLLGVFKFCRMFMESYGIFVSSVSSGPARFFSPLGAFFVRQRWLVNIEKMRQEKRANRGGKDGAQACFFYL